MEEHTMKTRHALALIVSAFCLIFAIMCTVSFVLYCVDLAGISTDGSDLYGATLAMFIIGLSTRFIWIIGTVNAAMGAILPISAIKKYGKGLNAACISLSAINLLILIALVVFRFLMFEF